MTNSFARISAFVSPKDFFDEIIPRNGIEVAPWRIYTSRTKIPVHEKDGSMCLHDTTRIFAETEYKEERLSHFDKEMLPNIRQIIKALVGLRTAHLPGNVFFCLCSQDFVKDGVSRNMHPIQINLGVNIRLRTVAIDGAVVYDSEKEEAEQKKREIEQDIALLRDIKDELKAKSAKYVNHLGDEYFRRAWESFALALTSNKQGITHLYDIRDAIQKKFKTEVIARKTLNLKKEDWSRFGSIYNNGPIEGGRHLGAHPAPLKPMTDDLRRFVVDFAKTMLFAYGDYLNDQAYGPK